jgi:hypothetical protein
MKRRHNGNCVELSVTPHPARVGWETVRFNYDAGNPQHLAQVEAAITAFTKARSNSAMVGARGERVRDLPPRWPAEHRSGAGAAP